MTTLEEDRAELERRLARIRRAWRMQLLYTVAALALGAGIGFAIAEAVIDPIVVVTNCGGIRV